MEQLLSAKQAAEVLACSEAAMRKWVYQRRLPAVKVGRLTRLRAKDLEGSRCQREGPSRQKTEA